MTLLLAVITSGILFLAGLVSISPYAFVIGGAYSAYKGKLDKGGYSILPEIVLNAFLLGICYPIYSYFSWGRKIALVIFVVHVSFYLVALALTLIDLLLTKKPH